MDDDQLDKVMAEYSDFLVTEDGQLDARSLKLLCQEIERQTRSRAVSAIFAVANAVNHKEDVQRKLRLDVQPAGSE